MVLKGVRYKTVDFTCSFLKIKFIPKYLIITYICGCEVSALCLCLQPPLKYSFPQRHPEGYILEISHFTDAIKKKESLRTTDDVLRSWHVIDAIERSFHWWKTSHFRVLTLGCGHQGSGVLDISKMYFYVYF